MYLFKWSVSALRFKTSMERTGMTLLQQSVALSCLATGVAAAKRGRASMESVKRRENILAVCLLGCKGCWAVCWGTSAIVSPLFIPFRLTSKGSGYVYASYQLLV